MANFWMVRAGEGGYLIDEFERQNAVSIGWAEAGDLSNLRSPDAIRQALQRGYPDAKPGTLNVWTGVVHKFRHVFQLGDRVISYDPERREYLLGSITSDYEYRPGQMEDAPNLRRVRWERRVSRDTLSVSTKNTLGSTVTIFEPGPDVLREIESGLQKSVVPPISATREESGEQAEEEFEVIRRDTLSRSHEFIKDRILALSDSDMEILVAALLRAMGFKARVTPKGPDRGRDVIASPDGLGFQSPRIIAEVKHRKQAMDAERIRGFSGGLRTGDRGLYVSTGGFTKEAKYEADRASVPITLVDLDELASLIVEHYDRFDSEGRALLPLVRVYWPAR